jgi:energy-coupling factor transporter ATP-binding protein EcfA2
VPCPKNRAGSPDVLGLLREATDTGGQTVVMVTHDPVAASYADRVLFLADGMVVDDVATLVALLYGAAVLTACGVLLESALRYHGVPQQYGASTVVVAATELTIAPGSGEDLSVDRYPLPEGGRVSTSLAARIAAMPSVRRVVTDETVPVQLMAGASGGSSGSASAAWSASGHPWSAAPSLP